MGGADLPRINQRGERRGRPRHTPSESELKAAQEVKTQVDALAASGDAQGAAALAKRNGAFVPGEPLPFGQGAVAVFDGKRLETADINGYEVTERDFDPTTLRVKG
jgi:hypothetical protein